MAVVSHLIENQFSCLLIIINNQVLHEQADAEEADVSRYYRYWLCVVQLFEFWLHGDSCCKMNLRVIWRCICCSTFSLQCNTLSSSRRCIWCQVEVKAWFILFVSVCNLINEQGWQPLSSSSSLDLFCIIIHHYWKIK